MSYILDALRRSEQDRKKGDVPDLQSQPDVLVRQSSVPQRADRTKILVWLSSILAAALLFWLLPIPKDTDKGGPSLVEPVASLNRAQPASEDPIVRAEVAEQQQLSSDALHLDALKGVELNTSPVDEAGVSVPKEPASPPAAEPSANAVVAMRTQSEETAEPPHDSSQTDPQLSISTASTDSPDSSSGPYDGIPHQRQLPYDLQDALPDLEISVHMYSAIPSSRLVRINNTIYREGDLINSELKLEEITRDGLIMSIRNERFWQHAR